MEAGFTCHAAAPPADAHSVIAAAAASGSSPWASTSPRAEDESSALRRQLVPIAQAVLGRQPPPSWQPPLLRRLVNLRADKEVRSHPWRQCRSKAWTLKQTQ